MTTDEIMMLWVYARQLWPLFEIPEDETARRVKVQAWRDVFGTTPAEVVREAMLLLQDNLNPSPGLIASTGRRILERREDERRAAAPRLNESGGRVASPEFASARLAEIRQTLAGANGPLAQAMRGAVRGPEPVVHPCVQCRLGTSRVGRDGLPECTACAAQPSQPR